MALKEFFTHKHLFLFFCIFPFYLQAQDEPLSISGKIDFVNQNVWRGCYQAGASLQPEAVVSFKNWEFSVWGTTGFGATGKEIDLMTKYRWNNFSVGVTDYWCDGATAPYGRGHLPEINWGYVFSKVPLSLSFNSVVYGDNGRLSSYLEAVYSPLWKDWQLEFAAGITPWENTMLDTERLTVTRLSVGIHKTLFLSGAFSLQAFTGLTYNVHADHAFWVAGISIPF